MLSKVSPSGELLNRWRRIEEDEEENDDSDPSAVRRLNQRKEQWFTDAFTLLISLPKDTHIWCGHGDIMGPLIETFYNYFKDDRVDSPLKVLWKRISEEMRLCAQCICQHHQTQEMYEKEYECSSVGPLLVVLRKLDEERVTRHLQEINLKIEKGTYDPDHHHAEVVSVMYEVLMFPFFFDDMSLCTEFEKFIESIDNIHELAFAENQEFPGVYALLFLNRRVRVIGYRLARAMGKLRSATQLERLQPLLKKFIGILEMEGLPSASQEPRPRIYLDRSSIWLGMTSLLEFLEGPAFEEGILEPYPIFVDTVLNHISGDSPEFSLAVNCLKELFKTLGMSLEALRDGEHEKQRRHFLYFLLHQVPVSSNFSLLARRIGHKIALLIVLRGYKMNPPCPPFECAHMWGPSLVSSYKDSSLHISLRQPAIDLVQAILVSDATALLASLLRNNTGKFMGYEIQYDDDDMESEKNDEMTVDIETWLSSSAVEIKGTLGWKVATGSDDGGPGKESKNSVTVSKMCLTLIRTLKRLTTCYLVQIGDECRKQWTWVPEMGETFILSLSDPDDNVRQFGKSMLEHVSNTRGLSCGLKFLCSQTSHLLFVSSGVRHVLQQVHLSSVLQSFQILHHFFFLLFKLLKEEEVAITDVVKSSAGGFLRQPNFNALPVSEGRNPLSSTPELLKFQYLLAEVAWGIIRKCLVEGKTFIHQSLCQMTCVRLLEILPVVLGKLRVSREESCDTRGTLKDASDLKWLPDLIDWGRSQLKVVVAYWKRALVALLDILQGSNSDACSSAVQAIRHVLSSDDVDIEQLAEQISRLVPKANEYQILKPVDVVGKLQDNMMDLTVDETEKESLKNLPSLHKSHQPDINKTLLPIKNISQISSLKKSTSSIDASKLSALVLSERDVTVSSSNIVRDLPTTNAEPSKAAGMSREAEKRQNVEDPVSSGIRPNLKKATDELGPRGTSKEAQKSAISNAKGMDLRKVVNETEVDPLDLALKSLKRQSLPLAKSGPIVPKRQVIQLCAPVNKKSDRWQRQEAGFKRFRPPKLEDWFRKILQMDYYAIVGLASTKKDESQNVGKFREVPVRFGSPEQYIQIFQPLVLEEFKAQLQSSFQEISSLEEIYYGVISVLSIERVDDFHFVRFMQDENDGSNSKSFSENDLVLFTKEHPENSNVGVNMMGKVEGREWDDKKRTSILNVRLYLQNASSRLNQARRNLLERSQWHASRILNITSQIREFQALSCIKDIPVLPLILSPMNDSNYDSEVKRSDLRSLPHSLQQILKSSFNESQLQAISVAIGSSNLMKAFDISLIQGPPGTGKTRTIVAIISGLLASASHKTSDRGNSEPGHSSSTSRQGMNPSVAVARAWQDAALAKQLNDNSETNRKIAEKNGRGRVLICAQSNAAVDELVSRISSLGIYGRDGKMFKPYLVRVGNAKTVHSNSMPFFLDTLVDQRLAEERMRINESKSNKGADSSALLRSNLEKVVDQITHFEAKRANINQESLDAKDKPENEHHNKDDDGKLMSDAELGIRLRRLYEQKRKIYKDLSAVQAQERKANYEMRTLKQKLRKSILKEAQIVVTTLSGCGGDLYSVCAESLAAHKFGSPSEDNLFDAVVIDEAAQALEPATLIPLQLLKSRGTKCIMVGDPKQLPATVLSNVASKFLYECSMFERLQRAGYPILMLTQQYRMHPEICRFPSMHFYDNKLLNGVDMSSKSAPFHENHHLGPYVFYDIVDGQEHRSGDSSSVCNEQEAEAAVQLLRFFKKRYPSEFVAGRIGIITPYKRQLAVLRSRFTGAFGAQVTADMEMNTVDGFQGKEVDILVLSTVRATHSAPDGVNQSRIGFVADVRRMNVALTRAKLSLWVLGNTRTLQRDHNWGALVKDAKEREVIIPVKRPYNYMFGENVMEQNHSENLPKNFPKPDKQHSRRKEQRAETSSDRKLRKTDGDVVPISSKGSESKHTRRNAKEEASSQREKLVASCEKVTSEETLRRSHEKKEKMKGREKSSNPEITDANSSKNENSNEWKKSKKASSKLDSSKRANPTDKIGQQDRQINKGNASNQGGVEDMISKRKQQREAVAAILNSSLIPSHKPKPPKRPLSPGSTAGSHTRPPKAIKESTKNNS
ncbi:P-loop containing nucleoside triphosphate hydrolases superfamily protein [Arabidopsis thaliana]|uniref:P-loop containing nucleoside triphosphate hydrolases superfamily protein n=1 Tax=Arabidopsis thaliana TaxID=3702 RepID=F4I5Z7_ARATH|nr:P-loop containing nucleoside triphosphate hydrolases superfamily protein [Arabidopsis thaliana]AEE29498.2 P-loop containing nucleoside triphosphate hydrolases superfamily protein [Arabidopsis thaliana]|eukprot:NP_001319022.1 P-loop containing nucleoside triphosphate hydrolases superfamily protein [Arabidopsis thaliana]